MGRNPTEEGKDHYFVGGKEFQSQTHKRKQVFAAGDGEGGRRNKIRVRRALVGLCINVLKKKGEAVAYLRDKKKRGFNREEEEGHFETLLGKEPLVLHEGGYAS